MRSLGNPCVWVEQVRRCNSVPTRTTGIAIAALAWVGAKAQVQCFGLVAPELAHAQNQLQAHKQPWSGLSHFSELLLTLAIAVNHRWSVRWLRWLRERFTLTARVLHVETDRRCIDVPDKVLLR